MGNLLENLDIEAKKFREVLSFFPTGVTVVTACDPVTKAQVGITINSFASVSLEPKLVLWSLSKKSPNFSAFGIGSEHLIHFLNSNQTELALNFSKPKMNKFQGIEISNKNEETRPPQLQDCCAVLRCLTEKIVDAGDHWVILAKVFDYESAERDSLLFYRSQFLSVTSTGSSCG